ncbi:hypothetical protein B296_00002966 [Ensete ventricosum]|uniref:Uncharacterized protein n=1 Tax=Ensete ventricosum TaxID=4639 RepID=A0A427BAW2_ENSVE|nr:hypothetical protein B296_00002966 [Ensete ventricosum]
MKGRGQSGGSRGEGPTALWLIRIAIIFRLFIFPDRRLAPAVVPDVTWHDARSPLEVSRGDSPLRKCARAAGERGDVRIGDHLLFAGEEIQETAVPAPGCHWPRRP